MWFHSLHHRSLQAPKPAAKKARTLGTSGPEGTITPSCLGRCRKYSQCQRTVHPRSFIVGSGTQDHTQVCMCTCAHTHFPKQHPLESPPPLSVCEPQGQKHQQELGVICCSECITQDCLWRMRWRTHWRLLAWSHSYFFSTCYLLAYCFSYRSHLLFAVCLFPRMGHARGPCTCCFGSAVSAPRARPDTEQGLSDN